MDRVKTMIKKKQYRIKIKGRGSAFLLLSAKEAKVLKGLVSQWYDLEKVVLQVSHE